MLSNVMAKKFKTSLPEKINTIEEAKKFLRELHANNEHYHCEDDANDCLQGYVTKEQGDRLNKLMNDIYSLDCNKDRTNLGFCPCGFLLMEMREFKVIDLTGRGNHSGPCSGNILLETTGEVSEENDEDQNLQIEELHYWIETCEDGEEFQTNDTKYIRIN